MSTIVLLLYTATTISNAHNFVAGGPFVNYFGPSCWIQSLAYRPPYHPPPPQTHTQQQQQNQQQNKQNIKL